MTSDHNDENSLNRSNGTAFEMLDQTAPQGNKRKLRPEMLVGLVLLLAIVGWGAFDWWQNQASLSNYRDGHRYAAARDWDAALVSYSAAGDYADSKDRATEAAGLIKLRNTGYETASRAAGAENWLLALASLRSVSQIQPQYRDTEQLQKRAEAQVYTQALSGTVALRLDAEPPGLYLRDAAGWTWLEGSDANSSVLGYGNSCCVVYDAPLAGATPARVRPTPQPTEAPVYRAGIPGAAGPNRRAILAQHEGAELSYQTLNLAPAQFYYFNWGNDFVRAESYDSTVSTDIDPRLRRVDGYSPYFGYAYQSYSSPLTATFTLPDSAWAILSNTDSQSFLVGDYTNNEGPNPETALYLADFTGKERKLLAKRPATVVSAQLSPDGRYLLLQEYIPSATRSVESDQLVLLPLNGGAEKVLAARELTSSQAIVNQPLTGSFIGSGALAGTLIVTEKAGGRAVVRIIDPRNPDQPLWSGGGRANEPDVNTIEIDGGLMLLWVSSPRSAYNNPSNTALYVDANYMQAQVQFELAPDNSVWRAWRRGNQLVYCTFAWTTENPVTAQFDFKILTLDQQGSAATTSDLYFDDGKETGIVQRVGPGYAWKIGSGLFAYVKNGELHARSYDDATDLVLEHGVGPLFWYPY